MKLMQLTLLAMSVVFAISMISVASLKERVKILEATIEKPELIHTCNLYDHKRRKICGWIEVE